MNETSPSCHPPGSPIPDGNRNADGWPQILTSPSRLGRSGNTRWLLCHSGWTSSPPTPPVACTKLYIRIFWEVPTALNWFTGCLFLCRSELSSYFYCIYITLTKCWTRTHRLCKAFLGCVFSAHTRSDPSFSLIFLHLVFLTSALLPQQTH